MQPQLLIEMIHNHLDAHPTDWQSRSELADLYEDVGDTEIARLQRWLVQWKRAPMRDAESHPDRPWYWWVAIGRACDATARLGWIADCLPPKNYINGGYPSRKEAECVLFMFLLHENWPDPST